MSSKKQLEKDIENIATELVDEFNELLVDKLNAYGINGDHDEVVEVAAKIVAKVKENLK